MPPSRGIRIVIDRSTRQLHLLAGDELMHTHPVVIGENAAADKRIEGDAATPLGAFYVCAKNPRSKFFLSLCLSYPNVEDAHRGLAAGLIDRREHGAILDAIASRRMPPQRTRLGGEIYIHGQSLAGRVPFTRGCVALDNVAMRQVYDLSELGTPVDIVAG